MTLREARVEVLSGATVAVSLVPEAVSFAMIVGAAPQVGLWAAFFMAISTALFGGRPGLISGATGATAVIMSELVRSHGMPMLYDGVVVAGIVQLIAWVTGSWKAFAKIPHGAVSGFLIALALLILSGQARYLHVGDPSNGRIALTFAVAAISALVMHLSSKRFKFPPAISAIAIGSALGIPLCLATVGDLSHVSAALPTFKIPDLSLSTVLTVLPYSIGMAIAGLTESLLTVDSVSHRINSHGDKGRETMAQGIGNVVSGLFSTMGGCVLVGQTNLNILSGARRRLSGISAAIGLLLIVTFFAKYIEAVPLAGLIGVMLVVVYQTGDWRSIATRNVSKLAVILSTVIASLASRNLAIGVIVGTFTFYLVKYIRNTKLANAKHKDS